LRRYLVDVERAIQQRVVDVEEVGVEEVDIVGVFQE